MQRIYRLIGIVLVLALMVPTANAQQPARSYLLLGKADKLPANLEQLVAAKGGTVNYTVPAIGLAVITSANPNFQAEMESVVDVESVAPDIQIRYEMPGFEPATSEDSLPVSGDEDVADPLYGLQWNLDAIQAPEAWAMGARGEGVRVAILDDGIYADHPDLAPNLNITHSTSFVPMSLDWQYNQFWQYTDFSSLFETHASYVTGIIAAADNGFGIIGVAPEAEIVGVRVLTYMNGESVGMFSWLAAGIVYAANIDSDVINMSLGGWLNKDGTCGDNVDEQCYTKKDANELKKLLDRATRYAHKQGAVMVAAAGNDGVDTDHNGKRYFLPAESDKVLAISATGPIGWGLDQTVNLDSFAAYSNYGKSLVDFAAPGGNPALLGRDDLVCNPHPIYGSTDCDLYDSVLGPFPFPLLPEILASGTSGAAAHVSGVAALIIGQNGGEMKPKDVERALKEGADDLGKKGADAYFGEGRVNAAASLAWLARKSKEKDVEEVEDAESTSATCAEAEWVCPEASKNVIFLGLISNR